VGAGGVIFDFLPPRSGKFAELSECDSISPQCGEDR
jgi:hypothetical protein